jgi:hypothetical protein
MPVGLLFLFAGLFVFPAFGRCNAKIGDTASVLEAADFRVARLCATDAAREATFLRISEDCFDLRPMLTPAKVGDASI